MAYTNFRKLFEETSLKLRECERALRSGEVSASEIFASELGVDCFFYRNLYELKKDFLYENR